MNSTPKMRATCRETSVLPTPVGPANRKHPTGLSGDPSPARERLIDVTRALMASSCPKTTSFRPSSKFSSLVRSEVETLWVGTRAIFAMIFSISAGLIFLRRVDPESRIKAPASSITSMALSGRNRSLRYLVDKSAAAFKAASVYRIPWCSS